jgi:hypothetical protein
MAEIRKNAFLVTKPAPHVDGVHSTSNEFESDFAIQFYIFRKVNLGHSAFTERADYFVAIDSLAWLQFAPVWRIPGQAESVGTEGIVRSFLALN